MKQKSTEDSSKSLAWGNIVTILIVTTPYLFYSYEIFPVSDVWENFLFTYKSGFYASVLAAFWVILGKFVPLILMILWFISCKHWWYRVILVPLSMYLFQFIGAVVEDNQYMDEIELAFIVPVVIITLALTYLTRIKLQDKIQDMDELEKAINKPSDYFFKD